MNIPVEIAGIATGSMACDPHAAKEMLDLLVSSRPFAASCLSMFNPFMGRHETVASVGYADTVLSHLNGWLVTDDPAYSLYMRQGRRQKALKWCEMPFEYEKTHSVNDVFRPAGFREGITLCLHSRDGRHTGNLHVSTDDARFPTQTMMSSEIQCLQVILGNFIDRLRVSSDRLPRSASGSGCFLTPAGSILQIPGMDPLGASLQRALLGDFQLLERGEIPAAFLIKHEGQWHRVHTGFVEEGVRSIVTQLCSTPFGLTERELQIIELLISGSTNTEIATKIFVARTTVSKHLENIFQKLDCNSRTSVVSAALALNLRCLPSAARRRRLSANG